MKKYKELPFKNASVLLKNTDELYKLLLVLDVYDVNWIQGQRPLDYKTKIDIEKYLIIEYKNISLRQNYKSSILLLEDLLLEL